MYNITLFEHLLGTSQLSQGCYYFPQSTTLGNPQSFFNFFFPQDLLGGSSLVMLIHLMCIHFLSSFTQFFRNIYVIGLFLRQGMGSTYDSGIAHGVYNPADGIRQTQYRKYKRCLLCPFRPSSLVVVQA